MRAAVAALCCAGAALADKAPDVTVLMYDSKPNGQSALEKQLQDGGWRWSKIGEGAAWEGFGTKVRGTITALANMEPDDLVVITDAYDVLLNPLPNAPRVTAAKLAAAVANRPGSIIVSAESQCCVNALSRAPPGSLIAANGTRLRRACSSRSPDCQWVPAGDAPWVEFMTSLARGRGPRSGDANPYLNAGVVAGRSSDLLAVYSALKAFSNEDDQALMTEYLFRNPEKITLDYDQELFGNNRWRKGGDEGCMFDKAEDAEHLTHRETGTAPAFLHTSGQFWGCYRQLAAKAGVQVSEEVHSRKAEALGYGYGDPFTTYDGKTTQFFLPLGEEMELMTCGPVTVRGRTTLSGIAGDSQQWFDKISITEAGAELVSVEARAQAVAAQAAEDAGEDDVSVGAVAARVRDALLKLKDAQEATGPQPLTTIAVNVSGAPETRTISSAPKVTVHRDTTRPVGTCCFAEHVDVKTGGFGMVVRSSVANKFHMAADQLAKLHLDIAFTALEASTCTGMLPEIWGVRPISPETMKRLTPPQ